MLPRPEWAERLADGARQLGLEIPSDAVEASFRYAELLLHWTQRVDLTSHTEPLEVLERHFLDSWVGLPYLDATRVADLGSGGGFPGIALKLAVRELDLVSIESRSKKCVFQRTVCRELGLQGVDVRCERIEDETEQFPCVTARAFAPLERLLPLALERVEPGGRLLAYKGPGVDAEWDAVDPKMRESVEVLDRLDVTLPFSRTPRALLVLSVPRGT